MKNLLQIINTAQAELGLIQSSTVIGNTDLTTQQMLAYANSTLEELRQYNEEGWSVCQAQYNLNIATATTTTGDVTLNSAVITNIPDTSAITAGIFVVAGSYIPASARVLSVDSATQITMDMLATGTEVGSSIQFARDTYPPPTDLDWYQNQTWWDRTNHWALLGPTSPQIDQWHKSGIVATGPRRFFRQFGPLTSNLQIWPPPFEIAEPLQLVWEYMRSTTIFNQGSTTPPYLEFFTNDTDVPMLSDRAIILGIKWRFWEQKGFNWVVKRTEYDNYVDRLCSRDGASPTLPLTGNTPSILISPANVQDGFFPGPTGPNTN